MARLRTCCKPQEKHVRPSAARATRPVDAAVTLPHLSRPREEFDDVANSLGHVVRRTEPFEVCLERVRQFCHGRTVTNVRYSRDLNLRAAELTQ